MVEALTGVTSNELRDYATVVAAAVALLVFIVNTRSQFRARRIENLTRFNQAHQRLFAPRTFLASNIIEVESGSYRRDRQNRESEADFHLLLLEIERLAVLANNNAVPRQIQVYMFGSYAHRILDLMTPEERSSMSWELAVGYLSRIASDTVRYGKLSRGEREHFWR